MKKKPIRIFVIISIFFLWTAPLPCSAAQVLSDNELDSISAGGFDVNIEAVLALRQAAAVNQCNIAVTSGLSNIGSSMTNMNSASIISTTGSVSVNQKNMAYAVATDGDISAAAINNLNYASIDSVDPDPEITQENVAMLIAMNGAVTDSSISNINRVEFPGQVNSAILKRDNISIIVANNISNNSITNLNEVVFGNASVTSQTNTYTYSHNDLTAVVTVN